MKIEYLRLIQNHFIQGNQNHDLIILQAELYQKRRSVYNFWKVLELSKSLLPFDYISSVGNSFQLPGAETKSLTYDQVQAKVGDEYHTFSQKNRHAAEFFEKAESVNVTYDNYHILKLHGN